MITSLYFPAWQVHFIYFSTLFIHYANHLPFTKNSLTLCHINRLAQMIPTISPYYLRLISLQEICHLLFSPPDNSLPFKISSKAEFHPSNVFFHSSYSGDCYSWNIVFQFGFELCFGSFSIDLPGLSTALHYKPPFGGSSASKLRRGFLHFLIRPH